MHMCRDKLSGHKCQDLYKDKKWTDMAVPAWGREISEIPDTVPHNHLLNTPDEEIGQKNAKYLQHQQKLIRYDEWK